MWDAVVEESEQKCQDIFINIFFNFLAQGNSESLHEQAKTTKVKNLRPNFLRDFL
jgi:hypothetical protein